MEVGLHRDIPYFVMEYTLVKKLLNIYKIRKELIGIFMLL